MEVLLNLHLERLPEGVYLATSDELPGLLAQGSTIAETLEIAQDVARNLIELYQEDGIPLPATLTVLSDTADVAIAVSSS